MLTWLVDYVNDAGEVQRDVYEADTALEVLDATSALEVIGLRLEIDWPYF